MGYTAVIADDAGFMREILIRACQAVGITVIAEAATGPQAVECVQQHRPDLLILDMVLPGMNGFQVLAELKNRESSVRTIAVSTLDAHQFEDQILKAGAVRYLAKPFSRQQLIEILNQEFQTHQGDRKHG